MTDETFIIRAYGKSELAMKYCPDVSPEYALKQLRTWINVNPRLREMIKPSNARRYTPKQVRAIIEEVGEPDTQ